MTDWDLRWLEMARKFSSWSKDTTKVGCVLIGRQQTLLASGWNGPPRGVQDLPERFERPAKYLFAAHAEANAIAHAARCGTSVDGATAYVTSHPCANCAKTLIQAGISRVVHCGGPVAGDHWQAEFEAADIMFREAGVDFVGIEVPF